MQKRLLKLEWATNYNGFDLTFSQEVSPEELDKYQPVFEKAIADVANISYDLVGEEMYEDINNGDSEGSELEYMLSDEEIQQIIDHVQAKLAEFCNEQFDIELVYDHLSS